LFIQAGKIDVWNKIKMRAAQMDADAAHEIRREKEAAIKRKREIDEAIEMGLAIVLLIVMLVGLVWGIYELVDYCKMYGCRN